MSVESARAVSDFPIPHPIEALGLNAAQLLVNTVRVLLLVFIWGVTLWQGTAPQIMLGLVLLSVVAIACSIPALQIRLGLALVFFEAIAAGLIVALSVEGSPSTMSYLAIPGFAAAVWGGLPQGLAALAVSYIVPGVVVLTLRSGTAPHLERTALWILISLAIVGLGAWLRLQQIRFTEAQGTYAAANRLLTRLRDVAKTLPSGLDEVSLAQQALIDLKSVVAVDRAALFARTENSGPELEPLAFSGSDRLNWNPADPSDALWEWAQTSNSPVKGQGMFSDPSCGFRCVIPLRLGDRMLGVVGIESKERDWAEDDLALAQERLDESALKIDTAQLFSEVRELATMEERRRLAREIHDGIAQEMASIAYVVDDIRARASTADVTTDLSSLRDNLTRIISELRLSIYDLRSDVQPGVGLGSALTAYVRQVGTAAGITVHLVLDESSQRLSTTSETEILRIAQEAVTNARKHAQAKNLWVTCRVAPPEAFLRVADDGRGLGTKRNDSYGMDIMNERAERLGADLVVRDRMGGGTVVELSIGSATSPVN